LSLALEQKIAGLLGMRSALSFSRGSAGLYALLKAIAQRSGPGEVIVPTLCCETVALAALYAGHTVRFADVSTETMCATPETVAPLISSKTRAVIVVHLYGIDANAGSFNGLRQQYPDAAFVEDVAHALGGHDTDGKLLGGSLDYTLVSFADSKIIPGDGGMLLFGSGPIPPEDVSAMIPVHAQRDPKPRLALSMRNLVHAVADMWREDGGLRPAAIFLEVLARYEPLVVSPGGMADEQAVNDGLDHLQSNQQARYGNYKRYRAGITGSRAMVPHLHEGSTCWRCPVVFDTPELATAVTDALRAERIPASNHYFPLSVLFGAAPCPQGEYAALRMVNLWTEGGMPSDIISRSVDVINDTINHI
jgi:dTDP-4-amino-4,6-dideoxygalactose transaminase